MVIKNIFTIGTPIELELFKRILFYMGLFTINCLNSTNMESWK